MKEKEMLIVEAAIKLFATKGFSSTSIQEIATESGISKGAFYLTFKSKEKLLESILTYYFEQIQEKVDSVDTMDLPPREKCIIQITTLLETIIEHKDFMIMQSREQAIPLNENIKELIFKMHLNAHSFYQKSLLAIFGDKINQHLWDLSHLFDSLFRSYAHLIFIDKDAFNLNELSEYIMRRMDSMVASIEKEKPFITEELIQSLLSKAKICYSGDSVQKAIYEMKKIIANMENKEALEISLEVLEAEIRGKPRIPVIQGMLSNFKDYPEFDVFRETIASAYPLSP